jgi:aryl-alcohol dehydrogenase-like predicted oxidoreductase
MTQSSLDYHRATDEDHACDLIQAHLIEVLSCVGREWIDLYYLRVEEMPEEYQLSGALQALELAKQEGHVKHIGISCAGSPFAALGAWQFHDAFETLLVPRSHTDVDAYQVLSPLAKERRVGIVTNQPFRSDSVNWAYDAIPVESVEVEEREALMTAVLADLCAEHPVVVEVDSPRRIQMAVEASSMGTQPHAGERVSEFINRLKDARVVVGHP